jgi:histone deacetylase 11
MGPRAESLRVAPPRPLNDDDLALVHTRGYLATLRDSKTIAAAVEVAPVAFIPWRLLDRALLRPMRWAAAGTVLGARLALEQGEAINIGGGFHHASSDRAEGFCIYADIPLAIATLRAHESFGARGRILYIDLDAHMGNGVARCLASDRESFLFDMFNADIYPHDPAARDLIDHPVPIPAGTTGPDYLAALRTQLPLFLDAVNTPDRPTLAIYNAGTDVYEHDAIGALALTFEDVTTRDRLTIQTLRDRAIPWLMVTSGGYSSESWRMISDTTVWAFGQ